MLSQVAWDRLQKDLGIPRKCAGDGVTGIRRQNRQPLASEADDGGDVETLVDRTVGFQVGARQSEQCCGWAEPLLLNVNKGSRELDEAFVKGAIAAVAVLQPKLFQYLMRLEKELAIEAVKKPCVVRVDALAMTAFNETGNFRSFLAHVRNRFCSSLETQLRSFYSRTRVCAIARAALARVSTIASTN